MNKRKEYINNPWIVCLIASFCCLLWGSAFPGIKIGYRLFAISSGEYQNQLLFAGVRFSLAGIMVILVNSILRGSIIKPKNPKKIFTLSICQTSLQYMFFYIGLAHTTGVKSSIINGAGVFLTIFVSCVIFGQEKFTSKKILGSVIGFLGIIIINIDGIGEDMSISFLGEGFVFLSALTSAFSSAFIKKFSKNTDVVMLSGYQFFTGGLTLCIISILLGGSLPKITAGGCAIIVYLAFVSAAAYTLWSILLKYNDVSKVAVFKFTNPIFGAMLSTMFLPGESQALSWTSIVALMLVCIGILIVNGNMKKNCE